MWPCNSKLETHLTTLILSCKLPDKHTAMNIGMIYSYVFVMIYKLVNIVNWLTFITSWLVLLVIQVYVPLYICVCVWVCVFENTEI